MVDRQVVDEFELKPLDPGMPEDEIIFPLPLKQCVTCNKFRIHFMHPTPPVLGTRVSALIRDDDIIRIRCAEGRLRYSDGRVKEYSSRQLLRQPPTREGDCPGYSESNEIDLFGDIASIINLVK